ncbi:Excinuclease ATPase subunit [Tumidithrix helvetica PCC 7403]|uniref:hypothetical protein n=1 Tax=Tumidithrix helvetica TaxID=3457545 RepID=UPI003CAC0FAB
MIDDNKAIHIQKLTGLNAGHFADLVRLAQLIFDPIGGLPNRKVDVDWQALGIPIGVAQNLSAIGKKYQYESPYIPIDRIWAQLTPESRNWTIENRRNLWNLEEYFPARDED